MDSSSISREGQYSVTATARILGVTRPTVYRYSRIGALPIRIRKNVGTPFVWGKDIINYLNNY